jgi:hypothetical protein
MRRLLIAYTIFAAMAATAASAQGRFIHPADKNHDQRIDQAEWTGAGFPAAEFAKADKNKDKLIDGPEFVAWSQARAK